MAHSAARTTSKDEKTLREVIRRYWGYSKLRPLQAEAMLAACRHRDTLAVLPTGGGKSLCYQAPAMLSDKPCVVISPLIALMKDQVDGLIQRGIPAAFLNSSLDATDRRRVESGILRGQYKLIFIAPERLTGSAFPKLLENVGVGSFAIDEAHCISHWGHDFRDDYRKLGLLKERFSNVPINAFTATATPRVRQDICEQLRLANPEVLVGDFFRPNLVYQVRRRRSILHDVLRQVTQRNRQAGIVYCIRRSDVNELTTFLCAEGIKAAAYHAGMTDTCRTTTQDSFAVGDIDVVVATVAFGMGIDRSDIRFVIHTAIPKSIEHYQQETGRAGRDGGQADCILFYSGGDFAKWKSIIEKNDGQDSESHVQMLSEMYRFCTSRICRHRKLVQYFGQEWNREACDACDICQQNLEPLADSTILTQKILSAIVRTGQRYGAGYVCEVLLGHESEHVLSRGHHELSTFGLLREYNRQTIMDWFDELTDSQLLKREGKFRIPKVTGMGWKVLRSEAKAKLLPPDTTYARPVKPKTKTRKRRLAPLAEPDWDYTETTYCHLEDTDIAAGTPISNSSMNHAAMRLFERLRELRRKLAEEMNAPAFVVFSDRTLRAMAKARPTDRSSMLRIKGVGDAKFDSYGQRFLEVIEEFEA